ncbi:glycosyl transferase family 4 [Streptomyces sp. SLBN-118]|uniref:glycosyltransferase n=1 Tax=Streptomyces sp. SLBN-118 TaxID=2768454 RepID=UPI00114F4EDF|nr:glycosyltransferase [Streptomyces sp. SLBN-118]TQK43249.1 glycosyl transferase family 4 [Streptomyces sp. SLBN-118]
MRVVIVTESFPPDVNGVAHCALQTARHLAARGHDPLVIAPAVAGADDSGTTAPCPVVRVPSLPLPGYPQVRVALPSRRVAATIAAHRADLVHLASPFVLGVRGMAAAARLDLPAVAVYQTDLAGYARTYVGAGEGAAWRRIRTVHTAADRTLAGERGHRMIARRFHELLTERGLARGTAPGSDPEQAPPSRAAAALWLATAGTAWVARRCTDLLPQLMRLAGAEVRHWARGTSDRLDRSAEHALSAALAAVSPDVPLARMGE